MKLLFLGMTIAVYIFTRKLYVRRPYPFMIPSIMSSIVIVTVLLLCRISYEEYMEGVNIIDELLGAAVVALAYPLYNQRHIIKSHFIPIIVGTFVGTLLGIGSGIALSKAFDVEDLLMFSLLPKSVTTPVAMEIASEIGGIPSLAAVLVMVAGFSGVVFGPMLLKWLRVEDPIGVGIGFGCASHAIGTSKALEYGEQAGAFSSVAMTLCALLASFMAPVMVVLFA